MASRYPYKPDYAVAPGVTLKKTLRAKGLSQADLALRTGLAEKTISQIIHGIVPISYKIAYKLEMALGIPARFWNARERSYRQSLAAARAGREGFTLVERTGISLLEVLISIFVLSVGLLGVAALIPIGKVAMNKVEQSDRTGFLGRAALRDIKVRGMLGFNNWSTGPSPGTRITAGNAIISAFVIDPLGHAHGVTGNMGPLQRCTLLNSPVPLPPALGVQYSLSAAESIFVSHDDLVFDYSTDRSQRPTAVMESPGVIAHEGRYSWFATICPAEGEASLAVGEKRNLAVSIVVCKNRNFAVANQTVNVTAMSGGIGGCSVSLATALPTIKHDDWVMLVGEKSVCTDLTAIPPTAAVAQVARWYRVISAGNDQTPPTLGLVGPDWDCATPGPGTVVTLVIIDGVTGVYAETISTASGT